MVKIRQAILGSSILVALTALVAGCSSPDAPLELSPHVNLDRYAGRWYVFVANIPYVAERGNVGSFFDISFQPNGRLTDVYTARSKTFDAPLESVLVVRICGAWHRQRALA